MSEKIVLIDGHSIINRAFYGVPDLTNSEGLHTNAIYGFLNIMFRILDEEKPDYLAVAFDLKAPTFRHQMYDAYKGTRKPMPEELREQVPVLKEVLQAMGIPLLMKEGFEADDLLGTAARVSEEKGINAVIVSGDRDLLQLATDNVLIRMPKTKRGTTEIENYYAADVKEAYQVNPPQIIELKALMGDASDNIPGVPGIGEKTATNLIVAYGSIENAYAHVEEIKPNRAKEALRNHYDMAKMSKKLATICVQAPLELSWENAKLTNLYTPEVYEWFKKLNFKKLLSRFDLTGTELPSVPEVKRVTELGEAESIFAKAADQDRLAFEICQSKDEFGISLALSEQKLAHLAYFPPLNYCCYSAVPEKYIVPIEDPWNPSEQALNVMEELAEKAGNRKLGRMLLLYRRFPYPFLAKRIATILHRTSCMNVVDLLDRCLRETVKKYPRRSFGKKADREFERLLSLAEKKKEELEKQGIRADVLREEPFTTAQDNLEVHVYLMIWETRGRARQVRIETIEQGKEGSTW